MLLYMLLYTLLYHVAPTDVVLSQGQSPVNPEQEGRAITERVVCELRIPSDHLFTDPKGKTKRPTRFSTAIYGRVKSTTGPRP